MTEPQPVPPLLYSEDRSLTPHSFAEVLEEAGAVVLRAKMGTARLPVLATHATGLSVWSGSTPRIHTDV